MNSLSIPLGGLDLSKLTNEQKANLTRLCQATVKKFLDDPSWGRNKLLEIILNITPIDLTEVQIKELLEACSDDLDYCGFSDWNDSAYDELFENVRHWLTEHDLILREEKEDKLCQYQFPYSTQKCLRTVLDESDFCNICKGRASVNSTIDEELEGKVLDAVPIDENRGLYRETQHNILIEQAYGKFVAKGICRADYDHKTPVAEIKLWPLNPKEKEFCKSIELEVDDSKLTESIRRNLKAIIIQQAWKKYYFLDLDKDGEVRYIKHLKKMKDSLFH